MQTQIVYIHGGTAFSSYKLFIEYLKTKEVRDPYGLELTKRWKEDLRTEFGTVCDVLYPNMPNSQNAHYEEWKIWFERYFEYLNGQVILIGHSQGGYFLARYLSENKVPFPVLTLCLVAAPFKPDDFGGEDGGDFAFDPKNLLKVLENTQKIAIFHSMDDDVVPFEHAKLYKITLPSAELITFKDRGHFIGPEFPEFIEYTRGILSST